MKLKSRLFVTSGVPFIIVIALGFLIAFSQRQQIEEISSHQKTISRAIRMGSLIHEVQKERGLIRIFVATHRLEVDAELRTQRARVDSAIKGARAWLPKEDASHQWLDALDTYRGQAITVGSDTATNDGYTQFIANVLTGIDSGVGATTHKTAEIARLGATYVALLKAKEVIGLEWLQGATGLADGKLSVLASENLSLLMGRQKAYFDMAISMAPADIQKSLNTLETSEHALAFQNMRRELLLGAALENAGGVTLTHWNNASVHRINSLKVVEDALADRMVEISAAVEDRALNTLWILLLAIGLSIVVGVLLVMRNVRHINNSLLRIGSVVQEIRNTGNLALRCQLADRDELGQMAHDIDSCLETLQNRLSTLSQIERTGDLTLRMADFGHTSQVTNAFLGSLESAFHEITEAADQVEQSVMQQSTASGIMASNTEEQSAAIEELTASAGETSAQVMVNSDAANAASKLVTGASQAANDGQNKVNAMVVSMNEINDAAREISKIIKVIDDIAFQTNLLALNAAVEAARAGQYGRGFSVVAQEVRNLANHSAKAAKETADLIDKSVRRVEAGMLLAGDTRNALDLIVSNASKIKDLVGEIAVASQEQARGVAYIDASIIQIASSVQESSAQAEEVASGAEYLSVAADRMSQTIRRFTVSEQQNKAREVPQPPTLVRQPKLVTAPASEKTATEKHLDDTPKTMLSLDHDERGFDSF